MNGWNKVRWVASILLVFCIVVFTNLIDRDNFRQLNDSVTTLYEDRIVACDILYDLSTLFHEKELAIVAGDSSYAKHQSAPNQIIAKSISKYQNTKLTEEEELIFSAFKAEFESLKAKENTSDVVGNPAVLESLTAIQSKLHALTNIQMEEGRRQVFASNRAKNAIDLFTQAEIIFLVVMAIVVQIIIFYTPGKVEES
jgi:hypothetical protein